MRSGPTAPRLTIESLVKRYESKTALEGVSLDAEPGSFTVLLGPSGSGKSTLLRCVAGIERVSSGSIRFDGAVVADDREHLPAERRDLAMVFQDYALWPHMTTLDNVAFALRRRKLGPPEVRRQAEEMLGRVGLADLMRRYPGDLSGGEQQRVALARALVARPGLLLFDEPLSNLDADLRERLRVEIATLTREIGATALYITHDQAEAFALADRIGVLEQGQLVQIATPEDLYLAPATAFVARFTGIAGELTGRVGRPVTAGLVNVENGEYSLAGSAMPGACFDQGDRASILIRAAAVRLVASDEDGTAMAGIVRDVAFRGRGYDHVVELANRQRLMGVFHGVRHTRGQNVRLHLDPAGCLVFPEKEGVSMAGSLGSGGSGPAEHAVSRTRFP